MPSSRKPEDYGVDGLRPDMVVQPSSIADLSTAMAAAHSAGQAVIPWGGGTRMHVGNIPSRYDTALDLTALSRNIEHEAGDLTLIADAGVSIAELEQTLAGEGQRLPFSVPQSESATLGGSVASNSPGLRRSSFGGIRDWVIGMKVVLPDGTVTKSGGRVVKNVQGYDLHRLHTGAFGTLGVIAEVGLKVVPTPASSCTIAAWFDSATEASDYAMQVFNGPAMPESLALFTGNDAVTRLAGTAGDRDAKARSLLVLAAVTGGISAVTRLENEFTGVAGACGADGYAVLRGQDADSAWNASESVPSEETLQTRTTLKPRDAISFASAVTANMPGISAEVDVGFGTVTLNAISTSLQDVLNIREQVAGYGGHAVVERCPASIKQEMDVFGDLGVQLAVSRSIKDRFDPARILNPGRFAGRI